MVGHSERLKNGVNMAPIVFFGNLRVVMPRAAGFAVLPPKR
jgi:hypothetical protein